MKRQLPSFEKLICCLLLTVFALQVTAQSTSKINAKELIAKYAVNIGLSANDLNNLRISDAYIDKLSGATMIYLQQTYKGIDIMNAVQTIVIKNNKLVSVAGKRIQKIEARVNIKSGIPSITAEDAVKVMTRHLNLQSPAFMRTVKSLDDTKTVTYDELGISSVPVKSKLVWLVDSKLKAITLSWQVEVQPHGRKDYWLVHVDALKSEVINKMNLNVSCSWQPVKNVPFTHYNNDYANKSVASETGVDGVNAIDSSYYRVIPFPGESPYVAPPTLAANPWTLAGAGNDATTLKWNDNGTTTFDSTRGNNVLAQEDLNGNNGFGKGAGSSTAIPKLTFDFLPDFSKSPTLGDNQKFAITNLFYWNNIMHDISYQYGFDEVSGNFQANNLSRGGLGNDYVFADAQDGSGSDNANFSTPSDGGNPRMQMFQFNSSSPVLSANSPESFAGPKYAVESNVSTNNKISNKAAITANVVLYNDDAFGSTHEACGPAANAAALNGKIALLSRGTCAFTIKIKNAQNAGAVGVIVMDNLPNELPFIMGGTDNTLTIPAFMVSYEDGQAIMSLINSSTAVNMTMARPVKRDGDLDNGVIAHEYTHGISNRLTGGPSQAGCLQNKEQMGEGWSDYLSLMVTTNWKTATINDGTKKRPIGNYAISTAVNDVGIRSHPYSTDKGIDPETFADLQELYPDPNSPNSPEPHLVGEIWCTVLWDMTWNMILQDGILNPDIYDANATGGNSAALKLVMEGMKLQPCGPGFIDGRDAILKADTLLFQGKYSCAIWKAFTGRGMGAFASEGNPDIWGDEVADGNYAHVTKHADKDSALQEQQITYTFDVKADHCTGVSNYKIVDTLRSNVTYVSSSGIYNAGNRTVTFDNINVDADATVSLTLTVAVNNNAYSSPVEYINEIVPSTTISTAWTNISTTKDKWQVKSNFSHSTPYSFYISDADSSVKATLTTTNAVTIGENTQLSFWHYYNTEDNWDGGLVQISTDNGAHYSDLGIYIIQNGYNGNLNTGDSLQLGFTGNSTGFVQTIADLSSFANKAVKLRFTFTCDANTFVDGWYIDDILLATKSGITNIGQLFDNTGVLQNISAARTAIRNGSLPVTWGNFTAVKQGNTALLKWQTLQEYNTSKFVIERSTDGNNFYPLGSVAAAGEASSLRNYQFTDGLPLNGKDHYRLAQIDKDGKTIYSPVATLDFLLNKLITITPNPAKDKIAITVTGNNKPLKVYLLSAIGQQVKSYDMNGQYLQLNLPYTAPGIYYIKITGGDINHTQKLIIQ